MKQKNIKHYLCILAVVLLLTVVAAPVALGQTEVRMAVSASISTMDPQKQGNMIDMGTLVNMFDMLTFVDKDMNLGPWLATEWYAVDDLTWEFKLRDDVVFHNGEPFNAEAVKFSIERLLAPETASPIVELRYVTAVNVVDEFTVQIVTDAPDPLIPAKVSLFGGVMVPPQYIQEHGDAYFAANPVGTGPFSFVSWQRDGSLVLEANDDYWRGRPQVDRVIIDAIPNDASRIAALLAGEVDIITNLVPDSYQQVQNAPGVVAASVPGLRMHYLSIDTRTGPLANEKVRQAVNLAIDVETLIEVVLEGHGVLEPSLVPSVVFGFNPNIEGWGYDPERAMELLAEAGYPNGFETSIDGSSGTFLKDRDVVLAIAGMLDEVGIRTTPNIMEYGLFREKLMSDTLAPFFFIGNLAWTMDGANNLQSYVHSERRYSRMSHPRADELQIIEETVVDPEQRLAAFYEIQEILHEGAYFVPLWRANDIYGLNERISWTPPGNQVIWLGDLAVNQ